MHLTRPQRSPLNGPTAGASFGAKKLEKSGSQTLAPCATIYYTAGTPNCQHPPWPLACDPPNPGTPEGI